MNHRPAKYAVGDLVRFREGKIDWEVTWAEPHKVLTGIQMLVLRSGMSDRIQHTTNQHVISREEALNAQG